MKLPGYPDRKTIKERIFRKPSISLPLFALLSDL